MIAQVALHAILLGLTLAIAWTIHRPILAAADWIADRMGWP